jgi:hypothetical protein
MGETSSQIPGPDAIRAQVERMIASHIFNRSPQLGAFLRFVVESVLRGSSSRIKAYTIGVEVFRRDTKFDPQLDPIVRVEATRLRRTIVRYYADAGADDPVRIEIPRGSYVPTFSGREAAADPSLASRLLPFLGERRRAVWLVLATIVVLGVTTIALDTIVSRPELDAVVKEGRALSPPAEGALSPGNGLPVLLMAPFEVTGSPEPRSLSARALFDVLSNAFTHFDLVNILLDAGDPPAGGALSAPRSAHADYRFVGAIEYGDGGAARLVFRLLDLGDDSIVWSRVFEAMAAQDDQTRVEEKITRELAATLLQPFGVIYAHQRAKVLAGKTIDPRDRCLVEVIESFSSFDPKEHARGRDCLERLTARDPGFALGFTYLAAMDLREFQYDFAGRPGDTPPLARGLSAARHGVELQPQLSRAYEMLFGILFARHEVAPAFDAADQATMLNKYDMRTLAAYGARLIASGEVERGLAMLRQAGDDGTVRPPFEEFYLFLGEYLRNNRSEAWFHAGQLTAPSFQLGLIARALAAAGQGDTAEAARAVARLIAKQPAEVLLCPGNRRATGQ